MHSVCDIVCAMGVRMMSVIVKYVHSECAMGVVCVVCVRVIVCNSALCV